MAQPNTESELIAELENYGWPAHATRAYLDSHTNSAEARIQYLRDTLAYVQPQMSNIIGTKPTPANPQPGTYLVEIPNDALSIRIFPGGTTPEQSLLFFDFFNKTPINAPAGYEVRIEGPFGPEHRIPSLEVSFGQTPGPGQEKFATRDGARLRLRRPNHPDFLFDVPSRSSPPRAPLAEPGIGRAVPMM
ncbi:hypothetical protein FB45DRAFT_510891 [Roridomyces roridus]|uniref:Uncharacterized protein n=1 Tax=Roridomyces roridus TaxID=1738132 RepID=A0AAD7BWI1_9AGAR|nr:hypothetical protein FB45DRAFT_510891 [Roridomyces roridus]